MAGDILHDPLGQPGAPRPRPTSRIGWWLGLAVLVVAVGGAAKVLVERRGTGADPRTAVATIVPAPAAPASPAAPPPAAKASQTGNEIEQQSGITIVRPPGSAPSTAQFIKVPQTLTVALQPAPDPRLVEKSRFGLLPRRGPDGARPSDVYARPVEVDSHLPLDAPKIAIMVGGMGLNAPATAVAMSELPPAVTFGFAPYGDDLGRQVQTAREAGHEAILQVPMEGFGDPASASMSHLLLADADGKDNLDRLHWMMGRFTGYVGVANFLGGKFTAEAGAFEPVLRDIGGRSLLFFDDGTSSRSMAASLASQNAVSFVRADVVIDASADPSAIDAALRKLEARARERGAAVGFSNGLPGSTARIARFAQGLAAHGIALVPVSALGGLASPPAQIVAHP